MQELADHADRVVRVREGMETFQPISVDVDAIERTTIDVAAFFNQPIPDLLSHYAELFRDEFKGVDEAVQQGISEYQVEPEVLRQTILESDEFKARIDDIFGKIRDEASRILSEIEQDKRVKHADFASRTSEITALLEKYGLDVRLPALPEGSLEVQRQIFERRLLKQFVTDAHERLIDNLERDLPAAYKSAFESFDRRNGFTGRDERLQEAIKDPDSQFMQDNDYQFKTPRKYQKISQYVRQHVGPATIRQFVDNMEAHIRATSSDVDSVLTHLYARTDLPRLLVSPSEDVFEERYGFRVKNTRGEDAGIVGEPDQNALYLYRQVQRMQIKITGAFNLAAAVSRGDKQHLSTEGEYESALHRLSLAEATAKFGSIAAGKTIDSGDVIYGRRHLTDPSIIKFFGETDPGLGGELQAILKGARRFSGMEETEQGGTMHGPSLGNRPLDFVLREATRHANQDGVIFFPESEEATTEAFTATVELLRRSANFDPILTIDDAVNSVAQIKLGVTAKLREGQALHASEVAEVQSGRESAEQDVDRLEQELKTAREAAKSTAGSIRESNSAVSTRLDALEDLAKTLEGDTTGLRGRKVDPVSQARAAEIRRAISQIQESLFIPPEESEEE